MNELVSSGLRPRPVSDLDRREAQFENSRIPKMQSFRASVGDRSESPAAWKNDAGEASEIVLEESAGLAFADGVAERVGDTVRPYCTGHDL